MRNLLATTAVTTLTLCLVFSVPRTATAETALGASAWSLEIGTDVGTGNDNVSFAIRRHSGATSAFRLGIGVRFNEFDGSGTRTATGSAASPATQSSNSDIHELSIQWMRFAPIRDNVTATFAIGPVVGMQRNSFRLGTAYGQPTFSEFESWSRTTTYGLDLGLGVEWFFNSRVSLGGQTGLRATMGTDKSVDIQRAGTGVTYTETVSDIDADVTQITTGTGRIQPFSPLAASRTPPV